MRSRPSPPRPADERLQAAIAQATAETDYHPKRVDWRSRPLRCKSFEVTEQPASRIVELD